MKKIVAKKLRNLVNEQGNLELTLEIENFYYQQAVKELEVGKYYNVEFKEPKSKRSINQNKYMWALINEIAEHIGEVDTYELYLQFLEIANAKIDYLIFEPSIVDKVRPYFRGMQFVRSVDVDGDIKHEYKVYLGSSQFDTKEMNRLIDVILNYAYEIGVENYEYYYENLK